MRSVQRLRRKSKQQLPEPQELWNLFAGRGISGMRNVIFLLIYQNPVEFNIYENLEGTPVELVYKARVTTWQNVNEF